MYLIYKKINTHGLKMLNFVNNGQTVLMTYCVICKPICRANPYKLFDVTIMKYSLVFGCNMQHIYPLCKSI